MTPATLTPLELAVSRLPGSWVYVEDLAQAVEALASLGDPRARLALGARIVAGIMSGIEDLERVLPAVQVACGMTADPACAAEELPVATADSPKEADMNVDEDLYPLHVAAKLTGARPGHLAHVLRRGWVEARVVDGQTFIPRSGLPALASHAETKRRCERLRDKKQQAHSPAVSRVPILERGGSI